LIDGGWRGETALLHRDGHEIPVSQIIIPHRGNDGQIIYLSTIMRDITQRKQAENAVNQSKNQLQALIDVSMDAITICDRDGIFLAGNQALQKRWNRSRDQIVGHSAAELLPSDIFSSRMDRIRRCIESGSSDHFFDRYHDKHFENTMAPITDADGQIRTVALFSRDVTDKTKTEDELKTSEEYYRTIFENTATANILVEKDTTILLANANFAALVGYSKQEIEGRMSWTTMVVPEDREKMVYYHQQRRINPGTVPNSYEFRVARHDGSLCNVFMNVEMIPGTTISIASLINITERIRAEEALKAREAMLQSIFNAAPIAICMLDADLRILNMNQYMEQVLGYTRDEIIGQNTAFLYFSPEEYRQVSEVLYENPEKALTNTRESRMRHKNNKEVWVLLSASVLDTQTPSSGWVVALKDITDRMSLEDQLRQSKKMEAIGQLAGGIAHDFNNILTAILGYTDMVISGLEPDDRNRSVLMEVYKAGQRAASLTKQLLAFSRRQVLQLAPINLNQVVEDLVKMLHRLIGENIDLVITLCPDLLHINADRSQIEQVILNLSLNARDAMPDGGQLAIETSNVIFDDRFCARHDWAKPGRYVMMSMTDSGCGMDQETQSKIFEPFFTTKGLNGTGLGLSTVYGLVHQHNGMIELYSELGRGTRFRIYLPAIEQAPDNHNPDNESPVLGGHETILLAEDNDQVLNLTIGILENSGYTVLTAVDGENALQVYHDHHGVIDMLLLDIIMPKRGGRSVYDEICRNRPDIPCLFMSGYSVDAVHTNFILDQGLHLIQKPFRNDDLLKAVRQVLDNGR
ncbi:MAG: PAS domain S-box protein, partial [Candidatus Delongbacteria bacterium]|nr:PAS domain S-box protein [Candidatus Delongbacteria bacterium]